MIKVYALKKMAELFRRWKNELKSSFVDQDKTPEFIGRFEKIKDKWPKFVTKKKSERAVKMSATNKKNAAKKKHHHRTGSGGYLKARPLWDKTRLRMTSLLKGSNQRRDTGQTIAGLGSSGLGENWTL